MSHAEIASPTRRDLLKTALASSAVGLLPTSSAADTASVPPTKNKSVIGLKFAPHARVRLAVIGCGGRGQGVLGEFLAVENVDIVAVCDIVPGKVKAAQKAVTKRGQKEPAGYSNGDHDFENLLKRDDIDIVYIATPWNWHVPMATYAMHQGKHAAVEVPAAKTLVDCWELVDTSEKTQKHCIMMENCCYDDTEMLILNMVRQGMFGELLHGEAAYLHDLREELFSDQGEGLWRRAQHIGRNGNLYPTHGLGPVAQYMDINRGDRFDYLVSMSTPERGLTLYAQENLTVNDPKRQEKYTNGDLNTSLIKTAQGRTIMLQHDTSNPHPYDRINLIMGTKGVFRGYPDRIYLDKQAGDEDWKPLDTLKEKYENPLWKRIGDLARQQGGHGGMDFIMAYRLIECMRQGIAPDMDVYDAASWSVPSPLSELSVKNGSVPVKFPDFTRGQWKTARV